MKWIWNQVSLVYVFGQFLSKNSNYHQDIRFNIMHRFRGSTCHKIRLCKYAEHNHRRIMIRSDRRKWGFPRFSMKLYLFSLSYSTDLLSNFTGIMRNTAQTSLLYLRCNFREFLFFIQSNISLIFVSCLIKSSVKYLLG